MRIEPGTIAFRFRDRGPWHLVKAGWSPSLAETCCGIDVTWLGGSDRPVRRWRVERVPRDDRRCKAPGCCEAWGRVLHGGGVAP